MELTIAQAILATLFASFLFAFWYQSLNHLGEFPLAGFIFWLYVGSYITVWVAVLLLGKTDLPNGILFELDGKIGMALIVIGGGICMTSGLIMSLVHMKANGMIANQAIAGSIGSILNLVVTFVVGGLTPGLSLPLVILAAVIILIASFVIQHSTILKYREQGIDITSRDVDDDEDKPDSVIKQNLMLLISNVLTIGYSLAYMLGTRSVNNPEGFHPLLATLLLATGSLIAAVSYSFVSLSRSRQLRMIFSPKYIKQISMGLGAGLCHYGGTVLQIYSLPVLSAPVSALLVRTSSVWTFIWGIVYGEYKGAKRKVKQWLFWGILLYIVGTVFLTWIVNN